MDRWEVERDRFGVSFSGPLQVGECIEVVPASEVERLREVLESIQGDCYLWQLDELALEPAELIEKVRHDALGALKDGKP